MRSALMWNCWAKMLLSERSDKTPNSNPTCCKLIAKWNPLTLMCIYFAMERIYFARTYSIFTKTCFGCSKFLDFSPREKVGCFRFLCSLRHGLQVLEWIESFQEGKLEVLSFLCSLSSIFQVSCFSVLFLWVFVVFLVKKTRIASFVASCKEIRSLV